MTPSETDGSVEEASGIERFILGQETTGPIDHWLSQACRDRLGSPVAEVLFRSGRVDAVYGLRLDDDRQVVLKVHRPPADVTSLEATAEALRHLRSGGYPCPEPIDGPVVIDAHVVTVQSLLTEGTPRSDPQGDGRRTVREATATSLAEHVDLLGGLPGGVDAVAARLAPPPPWCRWVDGPWPVVHSPDFDSFATPPGWEWLDDVAQEATSVLRASRGSSPRVLAHADWYVGNLLFDEADRVVGVFDWELNAEEEAVVVGLVAGGFLATAAPGPDEAEQFVADYERVRPLPSGSREARRAATQWMLAFNSRHDLVAKSRHGVEPGPGSALHTLRTRLDDYR